MGGRLPNSVQTELPLRLYFPEWHGYAVDDGCRLGAQLVRQHLGDSREFVKVPLVADGELTIDRGIVARDTIVRHTRSCLEVLEAYEPATVFTLGGTCAVELGPVSYLNRRYSGDVAVVWLDAHADLNTPESSPSGHFHGMPLRTLLGEGDDELVSLCRQPLRAEQVFLLGVRDLDPAERAFLEGSGVSLLGVDADPDQLLRRIQEGGLRQVYLHLDLDVLDPGDFKEVICPVAGGMGFERLVEIVRALVQLTAVVGSSLLEFVPGDAPGLDMIREIVEALEGRGSSGSSRPA